ncbi:lipase secretion chaperone [Paraburkholderia tagetis]|uniref:lipase secretion chaperone n=1 Tax=Paraburkholderia tagetis TaxID=2913261 RepID=UPI0023681AB5|nr:lipase secretion chaperone [Paraburkholderia tagetis]
MAPARRGRRVVVAVATTAAVAAVVAWTGASRVEHDNGAALARVAAGGERTAAVLERAPEAQPQAGPDRLPAALAGTNAPRLPTDGRGHLARDPQVRLFFDYCVSAQTDLGETGLDGFVAREIAAQLDGTAAQAEALAVWQRYQAYRSALAQLPEPVAGGAANAAQIDIDALRNTLAQRSALASRELGEWSEPFFGAQFASQRHEVERLAISLDTHLTGAEKEARLVALDQQLPAAERKLREQAEAQGAALAQISALQDAHATPDRMRSDLTPVLGAEAAARVAQMQQDDDAWRAKYAAYASQRAQIEAAQTAGAARDASIAQLRERIFTEPGEALRAASFDRQPGSVD